MEVNLYTDGQRLAYISGLINGMNIVLDNLRNQGVSPDLLISAFNAVGTEIESSMGR